MWFDLAAAQGDADAAKRRDTAAGHMTSEQLSDAQRLARDWKPSPKRENAETLAAAQALSGR